METTLYDSDYIIFRRCHQEFENQLKKCTPIIFSDNETSLQRTRDIHKRQICLYMVEKNFVKVKKLMHRHRNWLNLQQPLYRGYTLLQECLFLIFMRSTNYDEPDVICQFFHYLAVHKNIDFTVADQEGTNRDTLAWACFLGQVMQFELLFDQVSGRDVDYSRTDIHGNTYLHLGVLSGVRPIVRRLAQAMYYFGISVDQSFNEIGMTPYLLAYRLGYTDIADMLEEDFGAVSTQCDSLTFRDKDYWTGIGRKERLNQQKLTGRLEKQQRMIEGRLLKPISQPIKADIRTVFSLPSICLFTTDEKPAETGIDICGRNWTFLLAQKSPEMSVLSEIFTKYRQHRVKEKNKSSALSYNFHKNTHNNISSPKLPPLQNAIKLSLPIIMEKHAVQSLPSWRKSIDASSIPSGSANDNLLLLSSKYSHRKPQKHHKPSMAKKNQRRNTKVDTFAKV